MEHERERDRERERLPTDWCCVKARCVWSKRVISYVYLYRKDSKLANDSNTRLIELCLTDILACACLWMRCFILFCFWKKSRTLFFFFQPEEIWCISFVCFENLHPYCFRQLGVNETKPFNYSIGDRMSWKWGFAVVEKQKKKYDVDLSQVPTQCPKIFSHDEIQNAHTQSQSSKAQTKKTT